MVLLHFSSYSTCSDIEQLGNFLDLFRKKMKLKQLNKDVTTYLQNIQNLRNSKTVPRRKDALMEITRCYQGEDSNFQEDLDDCNPQKVSDELAQWLLESWDNDACNDGPCEKKNIPKSLPNKIDSTIFEEQIWKATCKK